MLTGLVGAAGGLGGFFLPTILGGARDAFGSYGPGIGAIAAAAAIALAGTLVVRGPLQARLAPAGAREDAGSSAAASPPRPCSRPSASRTRRLS